MHQQDWLMQQIELAARVMAAIIRKALTGKPVEALGMFDRAYQPLLGVDASGLAIIPDQLLLDMLKHDGVPDSGRWPLVAELLAVEADLYASQGDHDAALTRYCKAAVLIDGLGGDEPPDAALAVRVADRLRRYELIYERSTTPGDDPTASSRGQSLPALTARLYERAGRYADAEDVLFEAIDHADQAGGHAADQLVDAAIALYQRLLAKDDETLTAGDLPRAEVKDALAELLARPVQPQPLP